MEMKMNPLFPKKAKKTRDEVILDLDIQLRRLEDQYNIIINRELRALRYSRKNNNDNPRAVSKIKNAYYGLGIVKQAQENLREVRSQHELCRTMNDMGAALKALNRISGQSEHVNSFNLNYQIDRMNKNSDRRDGGMGQVFKTSINDLVGDDIVERLISGETPEKCLNGEGGTFLNMPFSPELMADLEGMNFENAGLENELNSTMDYVNALEREL
ncbi:MAG: hypothetical protein IJX69_00880 [Oscillospiraceae bacterium]|nr:hypothetical protein [Oscillospiraceae bacterium]